MTAGRSQTAVQGVAIASAVNVVSKVVTLVRQVLVTAYFGLSAQLDAYFVGTSFVAIFICTFGDIFDSAGIPSLVKARERDGEDSFRALTGSVFSLAVLLGAGMSLLMVLCLPLAPLIVPGFSPAAKEFIRGNVLLLLPYALAFLPYHAIGSFFRSVRGFHLYYLVELAVQIVALAVIVGFSRTILAVPLALSAAYVVGIVVFVCLARGRFRFRGKLAGGEMDVVRRTVVQMLPVYLIVYGMIVVDRYFGSYLEEGAISALFYGSLLAMAVPAVMNIENVFITPLSEESDRGALLTRILSGILVVSLPVLAFALVYGGEIVRGLFQRGAFTERSSVLTADALRFYILGLPAYFALPVSVRTLQVFRRLGWITGLTACSLLMNAGLNYLFVMRVGMGVKGIALATSLTYAVIGAGALALVARAGIHVRYAQTLSVLPNVLCGIAVALAAAAVLPVPGPPLAAILVRGAAYLAVFGAAALLLPGAEMRRLREAVGDSFPVLRRAGGWLR